MNKEATGLSKLDEFMMRSITDQHNLSGTISPQSQRILERIYKERVK